MTSHFKIDIQNLISYFRNQVMSEIDYSEIVNEIKDSFDNIDINTINSILSGEKTLTEDYILTDENIEIKDSVLNNYEFIYKNYIEHNGLFYKAYAVVDNLGVIDYVSHKKQTDLFNDYFDNVVSDDYEFDFSFIEKNIIENFHESNLNKTLSDRALHYASDNNDISIPFEFKGETLFFLCRNKLNTIPPFIKLQTKENILNSFQNFGSDSVRGFNQSYGNYIFKHSYFFDEHFHNDIKIQVLHKNKNHGFIDFFDDDENIVFSAPKLPFYHWALQGTEFLSQIEPYKPVCQSGIKMTNDDPIHSDWFIASGLNIFSDYSIDSLITTLSFNKQNEIQKIFNKNIENTIIFSGNEKNIDGKIFVCTQHNANEVSSGDILVVPDTSINFEKHFFMAIKNGKKTAIISSIGSRVSHLVTVCREFNTPIIHVPNATERFLSETHVSINTKNGSISVLK